MGSLDRFSEATRTWFAASFGAPTPAQEGAWEAISLGKNALVVAPTGSGKTLSAFLWSIDRLMSQAADEPSGAEVGAAAAGSEPSGVSPPAGLIQVLYISPLKALGVDIERNLRSPLVGIGHTARRLGTEPGEISVGVRTGDSTPKERRDLVRNPPEILITTPESLYLMLTSQARRTLTGVNTVIIDEIHALAGTKRGAHLAVSLERLDELLRTGAAGRPAQRIGLSATVEPKDEVARFLGGHTPVEVVAPPAEKKWDITVSVPVPDMASPTSESVENDDAGTSSKPLTPSIWPHVERKVADLIAANRSTIVFVNSRRLAEKLTGRINEIATGASATGDPKNPEDSSDSGGELAKAHHGSVSKEHRKQIEEDLKSGRLRCVVATSSLELGIDMGAVDLVVQVEAPHAVSAGLQRLGRAGHQVGEVSVGWFFPKHRGDLLSSAVVVDRMLAGRIETLRIPRNPLDILAQQTIAAAATDTLDVEEWFETLRRCAPFATLPRSAYEAVLDLLAGKYPSDRFADLRPRLVWDRDAGTLSGRPGAQRLAVTSGGTIPDRGLFGVYLVGAEDSRTGGRRVGELDEEMVYESRVGDVFALGATSWRIEEITFDRVLVSPAFGQPASLPFWRGDGIGRPAELGEALGSFTRQLRSTSEPEAIGRLSELGLDEWAQQNLLRYLQEMHEAAGAVPTNRTLVVEQTKDELGDWRIMLHSPYGMQVHAPWALAVGERLHARYGMDGAVFADDDGIVLHVPLMDDEPPGAELFLFEPDELEEIVIRKVSSSALFAGRFREAAARALLLPRQNPGARTPLWQQRQRSAQLLEVAHQYPDFPVIMETMREVLQDVYDLPALDALTRRIAQRKVQLVEARTPTPSPFAQSLAFGYIAQYLYEGDSPLAERRAAALSLDPKLLNELLGRVELREFLDSEIIAEAERYAQRLTSERRLPADGERGPESVADLLRLLGPLTSEALAERLRTENDDADSVSDAPEIGGPPRPAAAAPASAPKVPTHIAAQLAEELVTAQRVIPVTVQGQHRYAAVEDAARLRDGLGVNIPPGVPQTFLEPVADPLGDLVGRYARTHGPFTAEQLSSALGLPMAVVADVLGRLVSQHQVVEGLFTPAAQAPVEYVEAGMLRRIRRRSLAALRAAVEPVPQRAYAQLLAEWQQVSPEPQASGITGLAEIIAQLAGVPAPASAWERFILPARVHDYTGSMLDELLTRGEVIAVGRGALTGHDGWLALYPAEDAALISAAAQSSPAAPPAEEGLTGQVLAVLERGGAWFPEALARQCAEFPEIAEQTDSFGGNQHTVSVQEVTESLWELFWAGRVHPDSFVPLRDFMAGGSTAHRAKPSARSRRVSRRTALRQAVAAVRAETSSTSGGRWQLISQHRAEPTEVAHARAEILLDRYAVLTRGSVTAEQAPGGFAAAYKVLVAAEEAGSVRRGYFVEGLGAAQFTISATIDRLREIAEALENQDALAPSALPGSASLSVLALAATDPANPFGAALDWPEPPAAEGNPAAKARPGRKAGSVVVLCAGELVLYMERGGRTMLLYTEDSQLMDAAAGALVAVLRRARTAKLAVQKVNGEPVLGHRFADSLKTAGFHSVPSGLRYTP
ncbi:DNA glycosylase AlkZ-like family protein [Nesterenkonia ebinurensis]|uniref:DNA glycosylase AlkZ-like family protein n=1 Tax=Nesterenkonia ebinurensis TaxID=2608252 RepID=UPI00168BD7D8|nr:crosslink repair DNA glycosylase YcaQ family protein [Nesterenkonia ebinurensis]